MVSHDFVRHCVLQLLVAKIFEGKGLQVPYYRTTHPQRFLSGLQPVCGARDRLLFRLKTPPKEEMLQPTLQDQAMWCMWCVMQRGVFFVFPLERQQIWLTRCVQLVMVHLPFRRNLVSFRGYWWVENCGLCYLLKRKFVARSCIRPPFCFWFWLAIHIKRWVFSSENKRLVFGERP